ncbi:MAG: alpha-galactosidase [Cephaloticoccus sp.]|nr:alpha-galactosidase [Cephaloticoccus sp.]MCF7759347.1 alpha-galactosidase [Cephaloticoccus sp.]
MKIIVQAGRLTFSNEVFSLGPGQPALRLNGKTVILRCLGGDDGDKHSTLLWSGRGVTLTQRIDRESKDRLRITSTLENSGTRPLTLNEVILFGSRKLGLGPNPADTRILEQNAYFGRVRTPRQMLTGSDHLKATDGTSGAFVSQNVTVFYNHPVRSALLLGFETIDRWLPQFSARMFAGTGAEFSGMDNVDGGATKAKSAAQLISTRVPAFREFTIGFDGGDYELSPGETLALGDFVLATGPDPLALLDAHGRRIKRRNRLPDPIGPLANWCSWYPYRLGVTDDLVVATARAARARNLHQLGLRFLQVDLGWEKDNVPSFFEENERFARGLGWLSQQLQALKFDLGVWVGVLCIAETHPIATEHPEWLLRGPDGKPHNNYNWFWEPFCPIYALDVSHPGAQEWLRENFIRLAEKGVRFVKWDFASVVTEKALRGRHDPKFVNTCAREAVRTAFHIAQAALDSTGEKAVMIDCSGTDYAAAGIAAVNYVNMDTGNSGLGWRHLREVYTSFACHLYKHHWALLQPSCLVVGLPGTIEEARIRATATFMGAGHVDIGDDLTTLPEDRWAVLLASLPPNDTPARPIDLFEPIATGNLPYLSLIKAKPTAAPRIEPDPAGACVWTLPVKTDWDEWTLVAFFNWIEPAIEEGSNVNVARRFRVELQRLNLSRNARLWAYEFWSGQFLGTVPRLEQPAGTYHHPGEFGHPVVESPPGHLDIGFHGPAVKLLVLRKPRPHPWPLGTSFHQSGGRELSDVQWSPRTRTLSGKLHRPKGESGYIMIACPELGRGAVPGQTALHKLPLIATAAVTKWSVQLK